MYWHLWHLTMYLTTESSQQPISTPSDTHTCMQPATQAPTQSDTLPDTEPVTLPATQPDTLPVTQLDLQLSMQTRHTSSYASDLFYNNGTECGRCVFTTMCHASGTEPCTIFYTSAIDTCKVSWSFNICHVICHEKAGEYSPTSCRCKTSTRQSGLTHG